VRRSRSTSYNGTPQIHPQNCPFPFDDHHPHLIHPSFDRPHSPSQTASGSNQPFCHSRAYTFPDRQTDRWNRRHGQHEERDARCADRKRRANIGTNLNIYSTVTIWKSNPVHFVEYRLSGRWPPNFKPRHPMTLTVSLPVRRYYPHPPSPFIAITQPAS